MKRKASIQFRAWNLTRLAKHVDAWFHLWSALTSPPSGFVWMREGSQRGIIVQSLYQSIITHLAMINGNQGVSLRGLFLEAKDRGMIREEEYQIFIDRIDRYKIPIRNITICRNHITAHRSELYNMSQVQKLFPFTREDIAAIVEEYFLLTTALYEKTGMLRDIPAWERDGAAANAAIFAALLYEPDPYLSQKTAEC